MVPFFKVIYRDTIGHWDVYGEHGRMFCIRGEAGAYHIRDEREETTHPRPDGPSYKTIPAAMAYIVDELMFESQPTAAFCSAG